MRPLRLTHALPWLLPLVIALAGCVPSVTVRPPTAAEIERAKADRLAIVLFQVMASIDGKPVSPLGPGDSNNPVRIYLASLEEHEAPKRMSLSAPSEKAAAEGWQYLVLPPGVYYLLVLPPGVEQNPPAVAYAARYGRFGRLTEYAFVPGRGGFWAPELMAYVLADAPPADFRALHGFWFEVPQNRQIVYLGSLSVQCTGGRGLLGSLIDTCEDFAFRSDVQAAESVAAASFAGLAVESLPLVPYGEPRAGTRLRALGGIDVLADAPMQMAAAFTGAELGPWGVIPGSGRAVAVYNLLQIGLESAERIMAEKRAQEHLAAAQPCIDRLARAAEAFDYASVFAPALGDAARSLGVALELHDRSHAAASGQDARTPYRLTTALPMLSLREAEAPQQLALELALEVRLEAAQSGGVRYYSMLRYAPALPIQSPLTPRSPLYAQFVPQRARSHPESEWCGVDGPAMLAQEISVALKRIAEQVARDLD